MTATGFTIGSAAILEAELEILDGATLTTTEFNQLATIDATTISANQWATLGGIAETLTSGELDILDGVTGVTAAELSHIGDVTGLIQAQINLKAPIAAPTFTGLVKFSVTAGITAGTTQTMAGATALTSDINQVSTTAVANDGVALPPAVAGLIIRIINNGAENLQIWPSDGASDAIDGGSVDAVDANVLAAAATRTYISYNATNWETF